MWACQMGHLEIVRCLVEHGVNVNAASTDDGTTALMCACEFGHLESVRCLVEHGASVDDAMASDGMTALMHALYGSNYEFIQYLLKNEKVNLYLKNKKGEMALDIATWLETDKKLVEDAMNARHPSVGGRRRMRTRKERRSARKQTRRRR
jgi:ankyrin repeat protein